MRKKILGVGLCWLLTTAHAVTLQPQLTDSKAYVDCMDRAIEQPLVTQGRMDCLKIELKKYEEQLNDEYKKSIALQTHESRKKLIEGQREWLKFRNAWCRFEGAIDVGGNPLVNQYFCRVDLTIEQTRRLKASH
jgi:uncharacterized protein YecT (DUF1311 family)